MEMPETADLEAERAGGFKKRGPGRPGTDFPETPAAMENQRACSRTEVAVDLGGTDPPTDLDERAGLRATGAPPSCYGRFRSSPEAKTSGRWIAAKGETEGARGRPGSDPSNPRRTALTSPPSSRGSPSMKALRLIAIALAAALAACSPGQKDAAPAGGLTPIRFATDWRAEAEHGGFYEALANGEYRKRGLDVKIVQGGPGVNVPQLLAAGSIDMGVGSNGFIVMNLAQEGVPVKAVAAIFQKDPQV